MKEKKWGNGSILWMDKMALCGWACVFIHL